MDSAGTSGPSLLPPQGLRWRDLLGALGEMPLAGFIAASPGAFLVELMEGDARDVGAHEPGAVGARLRALAASPFLSDAQVHYLRPREASRPLTVGRSAHGSDVVVAHDTVSKRQVEVSLSERGWRLTDLESANGTRLEGRRLPVGVVNAIESGAVLELGSYRCLFLTARHLHALASGAAVDDAALEVPFPELITPAEGVLVRDLVERIAGWPRADFVAACRAAFLLEVPLSAAAKAAAASDAGSTATRPISLSRLVSLRRSKRVSQARLHTLRPRPGGVVVGRAAEVCDLVLDEATVSKQHARLVGAGESWQVIDLESQNGTLVGARRIPSGLSVPVKLGQQLSFSSYQALLIGPGELQQVARQVLARG